MHLKDTKMSIKMVHVGSPVSGSPYSPAVIAGNTVYVSGQIPIDNETKQIVREDFEKAVHQCFKNLTQVLEAAGASLSQCVKVVVFLKDMSNFSRMNSVYGEYFNSHKPARSCIQVAGLPLDADVEIEAIAILN